jgi:uncharacterized protein YbcI
VSTAEQQPRQPIEAEAGGSALAAISREIVKSMKQYFGRGPTRAKSYFVDDLLFVVMRGGFIEAELTLLKAEEADAVRAFRQTFENVMADRLMGLVEELTGRKVVTYQSQVMFDPDIILEVFVFDAPAGREGLEETAKTLLEADGDNLEEGR